MDSAANGKKPRGRPFVKGQPSANPSGRPKGFRSAIQGEFGENLEEIAAYLRRVMLGEEKQTVTRILPTGETIEEESPFPPTARNEAARMAAEYAEGKPQTKATLEISGQVAHAHFNYDAYSVEELRELDRLLSKQQNVQALPDGSADAGFQSEPARVDLPRDAREGGSLVVDAEFSPSEPAPIGFVGRASSQSESVVSASSTASVTAECLDEAADDVEEDPFGGES